MKLMNNAVVVDELVGQIGQEYLVDKVERIDGLEAGVVDAFFYLADVGFRRVKKDSRHERFGPQVLHLDNEGSILVIDASHVDYAVFPYRDFGNHLWGEVLNVDDLPAFG